jgi:diguanylate cyclase (GGDEF)-like protein
MKYILAYSLFLCFLIPSTLLAKQAFFNFTNIGYEQGLTSTEVITLLQDKQGFIWIGTETSLYRYDGYNFIKYQHDPEDSSTLANNYVQTLFEDKLGVLWIGTYGGVLHQYHTKTDNFSRFTFDKGNSDTLQNTGVITSIAQGIDNTLWVASLSGGVSHFDVTSKKFTQKFNHQIENNNSLSDDKAYAVLQASNGIVWIGTRDGGLNAFNPVTGKFTHYLHQPDNPKSLSHNRVYELLEDSKGTLWIGTRGGGLNRFNSSDNTFTHYKHHPDKSNSISSDLIFSMYEDSAGTLWVGTRRKGLNRFDPVTQSFSRYMNDPLNKNSLSGKSIQAITQDHTGNILVGTFYGGLSYFNPDSQRFGLKKHDASNENYLSKGNIYAMYKDKSGILWIGSTTGLDRYDEKNNKWHHYHAKPESEQNSKPDLVFHKSLSDMTVWSIFEDSYGELWVGTLNGGLNKVKRFDKDDKPLKPENYQFMHYKKSVNNPLSLSDNYVLAIHEDDAKQLWIGTQNGLNRFNRAQNNFTRYIHDKDQPSSISDNVIISLFTDKQGRLWIGTRDGGLNLFINDKIEINNKNRSANQKFIRFQHHTNDNNSLSNNSILSIAEDSKGILWLGTAAGLNRLDPDTQIASRFDMKNGLPNDRVAHVLIDKSDNIWLGTNVISLFRYGTAKQPDTFNIINNIGSESDCAASSGASFQGQDGKLYWGKNGQYCAFYPEQVIKQSHAPMIAFTNFKLLNKSVSVSRLDNPSPLTQAINHVDTITLDYKDNVISFEFAALHFTNPKANRYKYKLKGFNKNWMETDWKSRHATYTNLPAGKYTFTVKASNNKGKWNNKGRSIQLIILPPPWKTWWAYTLYWLFFISLVYTLVRNQLKKVNFERQLNAQLESKVAERTIELQSSNENLETVNNQLEIANTQLEELSLTDQLTRLKNRRFLFNNLQSDIDLILRKHKEAQLKGSVERIKESDLIFFLIDLDHFKQVNDIHGHTAGDSVLIQIKPLLEKVFRETDYLVRWGGEEFLVIARFTERESAPKLAERLRKTVEKHNFDIGQGNFLTKTCSIGYASYPFLIHQPDCLDWEHIIDIADHCLYAAKKSSRNAWVGLENINCTEEEIFVNITQKTQRLIELKQLGVTSSIPDKSLLKWDS